MAIEELQDGRYHFVRSLGSGGMGEVYLMQDVRINRQVAIKVIRSEGASYPDRTAAKEAARLFQREAKAIAALEHPNILPLYDFGEEIRDGMTVTYMVMPYCTEGSLATWLRMRNSAVPLSLQDVAHLVEEAADALQYAHDQNVIHLDVKASNFLLRNNKKNPNRPTLLLADFGIARSSVTVASSSRTIRATLAISQGEAQVGTNRVITLPGGQHFNVTIPAGVSDGHIIRVQDQGDATPVLLTVAIKKPEDSRGGPSDLSSGKQPPAVVN